jgi:hypothetical protein
MIQIDCSSGEYRRMVNEKAEAAARSASHLVSSAGGASLAFTGFAVTHAGGGQCRTFAEKVAPEALPALIPDRPNGAAMEVPTILPHFRSLFLSRTWRQGTRKRTNLYQM